MKQIIKGESFSLILISRSALLVNLRLIKKIPCIIRYRGFILSLSPLLGGFRGLPTFQNYTFRFSP